jgi:hypothetical protein
VYVYFNSHPMILKFRIAPYVITHRFFIAKILSSLSFLSNARVFFSLLFPFLFVRLRLRGFPSLAFVLSALMRVNSGLACSYLPLVGNFEKILEPSKQREQLFRPHLALDSSSSPFYLKLLNACSL